MMRLFGAYNMEETDVIEVMRANEHPVVTVEQLAQGILELACQVLTITAGPPLKLLNCVLEQGYIGQLLKQDDYELYLQKVQDHKLKVGNRRLVY
jgi:hypothetical protein